MHTVLERIFLIASPRTGFPTARLGERRLRVVARESLLAIPWCELQKVRSHAKNGARHIIAELTLHQGASTFIAKLPRTCRRQNPWLSSDLTLLATGPDMGRRESTTSVVRRRSFGKNRQSGLRSPGFPLKRCENCPSSLVFFIRSADRQIP